MTHIRLEDRTIKVGEKWHTGEELAQLIQSELQGGNMRVAELAAALETLDQALENIHCMEETITISNEDYDQLLSIGGGDETESVRRAVMAYIGKLETADRSGDMHEIQAPRVEGRKTTVKCAECTQPIEVTSSERPIVLECPHCGTQCRLTLP